MVSFIFVLSCFYLELVSSASVVYSDFPLQRTPDGEQYLINITFTEYGQAQPMRLDLSSPTTWVNTQSTICLTRGNLSNFSVINCVATFYVDSPDDNPAPADMYYDSDKESMSGKHSVQDVSLGNFQVSAQDVILAHNNLIPINRVSAGVLGLAYPEALASPPVISLSPSISKY
jgi:hypothetical protein